MKRKISLDISKLYFLYRSGYGAPRAVPPSFVRAPARLPDPREERLGMSAVPNERTAVRREKPPVDWDLVMKRNPVERLKKEKAPLGIRDELPALTSSASSGGASTTTSRRSGRSCSA
jgi:hypothetical protein